MSKLPKYHSGYAIDIDKFKKAYAKLDGQGAEPTVYEISALLGITYQTVGTLDKKPIAALRHLKILSSITGLDIKELIMEVK